MAEIMYCKHCGAEIPSEVDICPKCFPERKRKEVVPAALLLVLVCSSLLMVGSSYVNVKTAEPMRKPAESVPPDMLSGAYNAAINFVNLQKKGERTFEPQSQTPIQRISGNHFVVTLTADEKSESGELLRNFYEVDLTYADGGWKMNELRQ